MNVPYKIVGYLADWNDWSADRVAGRKMTHLNYAFARITDGAVTFGQPNKLAEIKQLKIKYPELQILISIGGWEAEGFSDAALTPASRRLFAASAVQAMTDYGFDGIDLDWEYPGSTVAGIKARPEDCANFTLLLRSVREKLADKEAAYARKYLLTIATGAIPEATAGIELDIVAQSVDFMNIMTYDFHNGFAATAGHHTNLFPSDRAGTESLSAAAAVRRHLRAGVPPAKLVLGCAFYGRGWLVASPCRDGLNQPVVPDSGAVYPFHLLAAEFIAKNGYQRHWDHTAQAPFLWDGSRIISYDDPESLRHKTEYIKGHGLGGAVFWEYSLDWRETLLNELWTGLQKE